MGKWDFPFTISQVAEILQLKNRHIKRNGDIDVELSFKVYSTTWENKELKGVDDYYLARRKEKQKGVYSVDMKSA